MKKFTLLAAALAVFPLSYASAQESPAKPAAMPMATGQTALPQGCTSAAAAPDMSKMMGGLQDMMKGMMGSAAPSDAQKANLESMNKTTGSMMQAMANTDPDLAFNCGMIAHHQAAIDMAEIELKMGKDEASKQLAQTIIDAQKKEIAEMTAWVEKRGK